MNDPSGPIFAALVATVAIWATAILVVKAATSALAKWRARTDGQRGFEPVMRAGGLKRDA